MHREDPHVSKMIAPTRSPHAGCLHWLQRNLLYAALLGALLSLSALAEASVESSGKPRLLFLGNRNIAPVVYLDGDTPTGVAVDLTRALAAHLSRPVEIQAIDWSEAQARVARGDADALIQINANEERQRIYDFSDPLLESQFSIFTSTDRFGLSGLASLRGLRVGVESGGLPRRVLEKDPLISVVLIPTFLDGFRWLNEGTIDAVVVDFRVGGYVLAENKIRNIKVSGAPITFSYSSFAVKKGNTGLLNEINSALRIIKADGTYKKVLENWKPKEVIFETREQRAGQVYRVATLVLLLLLLMAVAWTVTLRKELTKRRRLNRELRALSNCNQVLMRAVDEQALLKSVCRIVCEEAGYRMAWVGYAEDDDTKIVRPVAWAGVEDGYLAAASITWDDTDHGRGPTGTAIRTGRSVCIDHFTTDRAVAPWRMQALPRGYRASIALPLKDMSGKAFGALTIYSTKFKAFPVEEVRLLEKLAGDLAFGLMVLRERAERKRAEAALRESEERYRLVFENSPISLWEEDFSSVKTLLNGLRMEGVTDLRAHFVRHPEFVRQCAALARIANVNRAALTLHGASTKEQLLAGLLNTFTPESFETFQQELLCLWNGGTEMNRDSIVKTLSGDLRHVTIYFSVCPGYEETLGKVLVSLIDITERRQVQEKVAHLAAIVESTDDAIIGKSLDERIVSWNRGAERIYGYTADEIVGRPVSILVPAWLQEELGRIMAGVRRGEGIEHLETTRLRKDKEIIHVALTISPIRDALGRIVGASTVARDITKRKRDEEEIRQLNLSLEQRVKDRTRELAASEERMRLFFEHKLVGTAITSQEKGWLQVNDKLCQMLGYSREELKRLTWAELTYPSDLPPDEAKFGQLLRGEIDSYTLEKRFVRKDGSLLYTDLAVGCVRRPDRSVDYVLALLADITERKKAEENIQQLNQELRQRATALEVANSGLESFSYSVSHDLRAPLRSIEGFSLILLEDYKDKLDAEGLDSLQRIRAASVRMAQLIDDLLKLARVSRDEMNRGPVNLSALAAVVADELSHTLRERQVEFVITPNLTATGDARMLRIVFENLLDNACKFSSRRAIARIEFGETMRDGERMYFVRDNGAGFDAASAEKLFGAFKRFHTAAEFPGTGIGLATVQRIIQRHDGHVAAESQPDHGATFYFTLTSNHREEK